MSEDTNAQREIFTREVFAKIVGTRGKLLSWKPYEIDSSSGLLSMLNKSYPHPVGHFGFEITYIPLDGGSPETLMTVIKSKVTGATVEDTFNACAQLCGPPMSTVHEKYKRRTAFSYCHVRELQIYSMIQDSRFTDIVPEVYSVYSDPAKDIYLIVMENLSAEKVLYMNRIDDGPEAWKGDEIKVALRDIAGFHSIYLGKVDSLLREPWLESYTLKSRVDMSELWSCFVDNSRRRLPDLWTANRHRIVKRIIENLPCIWTIFESSPRTLIHNDFTPRNACIRIRAKSRGSKNTLSESERAVLDIPQQSDVRNASSDGRKANDDVGLASQSRPCLYGRECAKAHPTQNDARNIHHTTQSSDGLKGKDYVGLASQGRLCLYDWECAAVHVPQYDVAEFLAFTLPADSDPSVRLQYVEFYRDQLQDHSGMEFSKDKFTEVFNMACCDFSVYRAACYSMLPDPASMPCLHRALQGHLGYLEYLDTAGLLNFGE